MNSFRIIGGLLSAHFIVTDERGAFGDTYIEDYDNELLHLAHEMGARLLPAFDDTATGIPFPRVTTRLAKQHYVTSCYVEKLNLYFSVFFKVHLQQGVLKDCVNTTCLAGAGSLLLEFGVLSRLLGDPVYEAVARRAVDRLWQYRSNVTGLFGSF